MNSMSEMMGITNGNQAEPKMAQKKSMSKASAMKKSGAKAGSRGGHMSSCGTKSKGSMKYK